jgi:hypothetical protein
MSPKQLKSHTKTLFKQSLAPLRASLALALSSRVFLGVGLPPRLLHMGERMDFLRGYSAQETAEETAAREHELEQRCLAWGVQYQPMLTEEQIASLGTDPYRLIALAEARGHVQQVLTDCSVPSDLTSSSSATSTQHPRLLYAHDDADQWNTRVCDYAAAGGHPAVRA